MDRSRAVAAGLSLAALLLAAPASAKPPRGEALGLAPCQLVHPTAPVRKAARCGSLQVPEDHGRPEGRRIALRVAVVDADDTRTAPDPVFFLAGGPGQSATEQFPAIAPAFARALQSRDVVLVDQRGTGGSGRLSCPDSGGGAKALTRGEEEEVRLLAACARTQTADLTQYTTDAFARDLDLVRAALGYDRVNLVGVSYGTRATLVYLRRFPDRVRTLVLDGVAPPQMPVGGYFERDAQRALDLAFLRCRNDPACHARFPDPGRDLDELLRGLARRPVPVRARHPVTGEVTPIELKADLLRQMVFGFSYAPETVSLLPLLLSSARAGGDLAPLASQALLVADDVQAGMSRPLQLSVLCAEDVPFIPDEPPEAGRGRYLGRAVRAAYREACRVWPHARVDASFKEPVRSAVPALLLSGEADPVTPPEWAALAARDLPQARHLTVAGQGHGVLLRGCMPKLVAAFLAAGGAASLDASCLAAARPVPFFLDLSGPAP